MIGNHSNTTLWSLSSRRAWIEIRIRQNRLYQLRVALLTESVDWNQLQQLEIASIPLSLSSRRAWIEIWRCLKWILNFMVALLTESVDWNSLFFPSWVHFIWVALLTESVDWNYKIVRFIFTKFSRSPHGERGLKFNTCKQSLFKVLCRSPHGERGLKLLCVLMP